MFTNIIFYRQRFSNKALGPSKDTGTFEKPSVLQKVTLKVTSKHSDNIRDFVCVVFYQAMENNQMILMARPQMSTHLGDNFRVSSSRSR